MINRSVCTSVTVTSVFKTSGRKGHFLSYAGAKPIIKRLFSHQKTKIVEIKMSVLREIGFQILKC